MERDLKICMDFSESELERLCKVLDALEGEAYAPYQNINGGFAEATVFDCDDGIIDVELVFGIQEMGSGKTEYTEQHKIDRKTMELLT